MRRIIPLGLAGAAGTNTFIRETGTKFDDLPRGAWDPEHRLKPQDDASVDAEVLYPTVGLFVGSHIDSAYASLYARSYNRWVSRYVASSPQRLAAYGMSAAEGPAATVRDLHDSLDMGLCGLLLPPRSAGPAYSDAVWDELWECAAAANFPLSFHAVPANVDRALEAPLDGILGRLWDAQEVCGSLLLSGVAERHVGIQFVFAEFEADWVPAFLRLLDDYHNKHSSWLGIELRARLSPSTLAGHSMLFTAQEGSATTYAASSGVRLLWGDDYPHAESSWPKCKEGATEFVRGLDSAEAKLVLGGSARRIYWTARQKDC